MRDDEFLTYLEGSRSFDPVGVFDSVDCYSVAIRNGAQRVARSHDMDSGRTRWFRGGALRCSTGAVISAGDDKLLPRFDGVTRADAVRLAQLLDGDVVALGDRAQALPFVHSVNL